MCMRVKREREREREKEREREIPGVEYTSKKSPAAMEKRPNDGRLLGSTSGTLIFAS